MNRESSKTLISKSKKRNLTDVLGPVESLESYVKSDWWKDLFNANYLRTDGDVVGDTTITEYEVNLILKTLSPSKESFILDLCCGQGRHSLALAKRGFHNIYGLDRSHYLINKARSTSKKEGWNVTFKEGDARKLPFANDFFDYVVLLGNSFGYFESIQDDLSVLNEVKRVLKPSGRLLMDIADGGFMRSNFQPRSWEWIDRNYFVCRERGLSKDEERLVSREVITHAKKGVIADQFYAERLFTSESIRELLNTCGFKNVRLKDRLDTDSQRKQDLGMMEKRLIVLSTARKDWSPTKSTRPKQRRVAVILGDPRKRDITKPNATFDEDDFFTINTMKKALAESSEYKFTFFNNHETLAVDFQAIKRGFDLVLNLCDEGFGNDPTKELHIPSLLEVYDIPYTGGEPQCLAYCYDKSLVRGLAKEIDIPVPDAFIIKPDDTTFIELSIDFPVIVKPNFGDSSFGITQNSVCYDVERLENAIREIREIFGYHNPILVEQYLTGKDISVGIIGNPPAYSYLCLPIIEEDYCELPPDLPKICGYEAKWNPDSPYWKVKSIPAELPEETVGFLTASCIKLFERLNCRDYARFDWRLDQNDTPRLLEVNPNPGWCWDGHLAKMTGIAGISYAEMFNKILQACEERLQGSKNGAGQLSSNNGLLETADAATLSG